MVWGHIFEKTGRPGAKKEINFQTIDKLFARSFGEGTPPKTNMEPENINLEKEKHLQTSTFWVPC